MYIDIPIYSTSISVLLLTLICCILVSLKTIVPPRVESTSMICVKANACLSSIAGCVSNFEWIDGSSFSRHPNTPRLRAIVHRPSQHTCLKKCLRCWELFCLEHGIQPDGQMPSETRCQSERLFYFQKDSNFNWLIFKAWTMIVTVSVTIYLISFGGLVDI